MVKHDSYKITVGKAWPSLKFIKHSNLDNRDEFYSIEISSFNLFPELIFQQVVTINWKLFCSHHVCTFIDTISYPPILAFCFLILYIKKL